MAKSVAVDGQVQALPGEQPYPPADEGVWTAGPVQYETHAKLKVGGQLAIVKATCTFAFFGTKKSPPPAASTVPVTGNSLVELKVARPTKLKESGEGMLLSGDKAEDGYGNTLTAQTTKNLKTA